MYPCPVTRTRLVLLVFLVVNLLLPWTTGVAQAALFGSFGIKDEQELGRKFEVLVRSRMPLVEDPEIKRYVQAVVDRLATGFPAQPFPFKANVLLHNSMNAFAVPGGQVFVHTGLIMQLEHESELAGVLAHELAHVTQRHIATRMERAQAVTIASLVGALASAFLGGGSGSGALFAGSVAAGQATMLNYSRMDETEADQMGLQYLIASGYKPQGLQGAFEKIRRKQWASGLSIPEYLSTHPDVGGRVNEINARIQGLAASIRNRPESDVRFNRVKTLIWARYGEPDTAARLFAQRLATTKKGTPDCLAFMGQGVLADRRNQVKEAEAAFAKALACAPNDPLICRETGRFYFGTGNPRAGEMLLRALDLDPNDMMAQFYYARLLSGTGDRRTAHQYFEKLLRQLPEDAEIQYYYGRSLGEDKQVFNAFLHLAYSALYQNDKRKTESWLKQAKANARTPQDQDALKRFDGIYQERREHWRE
ncbi:MAG: M48 family metalloprotease [Bilophila sp.]